MMKIQFLICFGFFLTVSVLQAQPLDTLKSNPLEVDLENYDDKGFFKYDALGNPVPRKSIRYSLLVPGMGQLYNRRWWKVPLVVGAVGGMVYLIDFNQSNFRDFRDALQAELNGEEHQFSRFGLSATTLQNIRDGYDRDTQLSYMGAIAVYGVIAIEAFVDAHLLSFDISDDLSMKFQPDFRIDEVTRRPTVGISVNLAVW